jgi:hypothetical protein
MCVIARDNGDLTDITFIVTPAGKVTLKILSTTGTVTFTDDSNVEDSNGETVTGAAVSADGGSFSFSVTEGNTYGLNVVYDCEPPNSTGMLVEGCPNGVKLSNILSSTSGQNFIIKA